MVMVRMRGIVVVMAGLVLVGRRRLSVMRERVIVT